MLSHQIICRIGKILLMIGPAHFTGGSVTDTGHMTHRNFASNFTYFQAIFGNYLFYRICSPKVGHFPIRRAPSTIDLFV